MGLKTVCQHEYIIPQLDDFSKKYYYLIALLLFEFEANGYYEDRLRIIGFNREESYYLWKMFGFFEQENDTILGISDFDISLLCQMVSILPLEKQKQLVDHIILSSIDKASDLQSLLFYLQTNMYKVGKSFPVEYFSGLDFLEFFKGEDSTFISGYYPSSDLKDEIREQYGLKK